jgi:hypothetical protein
MRIASILTFNLFVSALSAQICFQRADPELVIYDTTSISLHWTPGASSAGVQLEYGLTGFTPGTGTRIYPTTNSYTIGGLQPGQNYEVYTRDSCTNGIMSSWSDPLQVQLPSSVILTSFPREEFAGGSLPAGWGNGAALFGKWEFPFPNPPNNFKNPRGPAEGVYDHSPQSNTAYAHTSATLLDNINQLSTPYFSVASLQNPYLQFWVFRNDSLLTVTDFNLKVKVESAGQITEVLDYTSSSPYWKTFGLELDSLTSDTIRLIFEYTRGNGSGLLADILLDDIEVIEKPICDKPNLEDILNITTTGATIVAENTGSVGKLMRFGLPGSPFIYRSSVNDTFDIVGVSPSQQFVFYLKDSCGAGNSSEWSGPWYFTTQCGVIQAPYYYPFPNVPGLLSCWSRYGISTFRFWNIGHYSPFKVESADFESDHSNLPQNTTFMKVNVGDETNLEMPAIDISALNDPVLSFYLYSLNDAAYPDTSENNILYIDIKNSSNVWVPVYRYRGNDTNWVYHQVSLQAFSGNIKVRFRAKYGGVNSHALMLDDVRFDEVPVCQRPDSLFVTSLTDTSASLKWIASPGTTYIVEYEELEFKYRTGIINVVNGDSLAIQNLKGNTNYKFYVRTVCGTDTSEFSFGKVFKTPCSIESIFPLQEGFESETYDSQSLSNCWFITKNNKLSWTVGSESPVNNVGLPNTGPLLDHSGAFQGKYIYVNSAEGGIGDSTSIQTQTFHLSKYPSPQLSFWYHMYGNDMGTLKAKLDTGQVFEIFRLSGQQQSSDAQPWRKVVLDLTPYRNTPFTVIFEGVKTVGDNSEMALDDITVIDSCLFDTAQAIFTTLLVSKAGVGYTYSFTAQDSGAAQYSWYFGDGVIDSTSGQMVSHTYTKDSTYQVQLIVKDDCNKGVDTVFDTLLIEGIGLPDFSTSQLPITVYPNPFSQILTIDQKNHNSSEEVLRYQLVDVSGKIVDQGNITQNIHELNLSMIRTGLYILKLQLGNEVMLHKLIKQ